MASDRATRAILDMIGDWRYSWNVSPREDVLSLDLEVKKRLPPLLQPGRRGRRRPRDRDHLRWTHADRRLR